MAKKITLAETLKYMDSPETDNQPILFDNPGEQLITFFTYKGHLMELQKMKIKLTMNPEKKTEVQEEIRNILVTGMKREFWIVFYIGNSNSFNINEFFHQFPYYDKDMFLPQNIHNKEYCQKHKIIREEDDRDNFGNKGMDIKDKFKLVFLTSCKEDELPTLLDTNKGINFKTLVVN